MNLDPAILQQISTIAIIFSAIFLAALWLSLIFWTSRDIRKRSHDRFMRVISVVVVTVLFLPGFLIYLILRPSKTLEEDYQKSLEEEALLQTLESSALCPGCERHVQPDWIVCPSCNTILKKTCQHCGKLLDLPWSICPYCSTPVTVLPDEGSDLNGINDFEAELELLADAPSPKSQPALDEDSKTQS